MSDVPDPLDWSGAGRGKFYQPVKQVSLRLDADVGLAKEDGQGYQTRVNQMLQEHAAGEERR